MKMRNKKILITGCCGTVGRELVRQVLMGDYGPAEVVGLDNNESELFFIDQKYIADTRASFFMADNRDVQALTQLFKEVDIVFHTAAFKHVVLCERSPMEAIQTNIHGVQNVITAARENNVGKVIFTSSDKAVNPTSVMGTTKLMGERLITAANSNSKDGNTIFASTRFGNVLGSNGSVIPIFKNQIKAGGPVTITDPEMTRFIMTIEQAAELVIDSAGLAKGGEVLITKMPVISIMDLAKVMIELLAPAYGHDADKIKIETVGCKPGEKLYEELMSDEETRRAVELERYFSVLPAYRGIYREIEYSYPDFTSDIVDNPYNSSVEANMSMMELRAYLLRNGLLAEEGIELPTERYWPGDKEENRTESSKKMNLAAKEITSV